MRGSQQQGVIVKSIIVLLIASLSFNSFAKGCFVQLEKKNSFSGEVIRIDFVKNGINLWASQIEVKTHYPDPRKADKSMMIEHNSKLEDFSLDNQFKKFDYSQTTGEVNFMFYLPRGGITQINGVPGISSGRQIASDWLSFGIKNINFNSGSELLSAIGGRGSDSRNWEQKAVVAKECFN